MKLGALSEKLKTWLKSRDKGRRSTVSVLAERINACSLRERVLALLISVVIILAVWYFIFLFPLKKERQKLAVQLQTAKKGFQTSMIKYRITLAKLRGTTQKKKKTSLKTQLSALDKRIKKITGGVIPAGNIADMLRVVLVQEGNLKLISMQSLPAKPVGVANTKMVKTNYLLVNQGMKLVFAGDYVSTYKYLHNLENMKWRIFWDDLTYRVTKYPKATVTIDVHTLVQYKRPYMENQKLGKGAKFSSQGAKGRKNVKAVIKERRSGEAARTKRRLGKVK